MLFQKKQNQRKACHKIIVIFFMALFIVPQAGFFAQQALGHSKVEPPKVKKTPVESNEHKENGRKENEPFILPDAIEYVMKNSLQIMKAVDEQRAAKAGVTQALSAYWPQVGASGQYTFVAPIPTITLGPTSFSLGTNHNVDAYIGLQMKVFDFGKTANLVKSSMTASEMAVYRSDLTRQNLSFQTIRLFYSIIFLEKSLEVQDAELKDLKQNLVLMQNKVKAGIATDYDALNTEVRIALSKSRRIDIENSLSIQKIQLNRLMGRDENSPLNLKGALSYHKVVLNDQDFLTKGLEQRIEIQMALKNKSLAQTRLTHSILERLPNLYVATSAGLKNGYPMDYTAIQPNFVVSAKLEVPLFSGFRVSGKIEQNKALLDAAGAAYEDMVKGIRADILQAIKEVRSGEEKLAASDVQVQQAKDAVSRSLSLYKAGSITSRELLDARTTLLQVELMRLQALFYYIMADYNLQRAAGNLLWVKP